MFPHEYRRVLEEQAKEAETARAETPVVTPVDTKAITNGPADGEKKDEDDSDENTEDFKEEIINPLQDEDPNRKEVILKRSVTNCS